jgi:hypothetical protein
MEYYERAELGGQIDNWCGPSPECLLSFCRSAGFAQAELVDITNQRASVLCKRHWPALNAQPEAAAPQLRAAVNNRSYEAIFHPLKDEYLVCFFNSAEQNLTPDSLFVEVDGYGTQALVVAADGSGAGSGGWQANCLRPPGLDPGRHEVRVRTLRSGRSNTAAFTMLDECGRDVFAPVTALPAGVLPAAAPEICSAELRGSGDARYALQREGTLVCYFRSPAQTVTPGDVTIDAGGRVVQAQAISPLEPGVWQANVALQEPLAPGSPVRVRLREGEWSAAAPARAPR